MMMKKKFLVLLFICIAAVQTLSVSAASDSICTETYVSTELADGLESSMDSDDPVIAESADTTEESISVTADIDSLISESSDAETDGEDASPEEDSVVTVDDADTSTGSLIDSDIVLSDSSIYVESTAPYILNIRCGPGLNYDVIGDFPHAEVARGLGRSGGWLLITYNGTTGYCAAEYTILTTAPEEADQDTEEGDSEESGDAEVDEDNEISSVDNAAELSDEDEQGSDDEEADSSESDIEEEDSAVIYPWRKITASAGAASLAYDGLSLDEYSITVRITHSGEIGDAEFILSFDGGETWTDARTVTAEYDITVTDSKGNVTDTGLTIYFSNERYTIDDEYTFATNREWQVAEDKTGTGIVYIAGVPAVDQTVTFMIRIVEGGEPGTLTYQYSYNGGDTWSDEIKSESDGQVDLGNGIVFMFYGSFMAGDLFGAEIIGEAGPDYTTIFILLIAAIAVVLFAVAYLFLRARRTGREHFELLDSL